MQRLFASDFDGTIHFWETDDLYLVSPKDTEAILEFQDAGGLFGVCTGRPLAAITKDLEGKVDFSFDFYICMSGSQVFDRDLSAVLDLTLPREVVEELYHAYVAGMALENLPFGPLVCASHDYWSLQPRADWGRVNCVGSFDEIPGPHCGFAMMRETAQEAARIAAEINERYAGVVQAYQNVRSIDVTPAGCSKGTGLELAAKHFGAGVTAGMGDSFNDLPLLAEADVAYTFNSSAGPVRAGADVLVDSAAEAIRDFMARK